MDELAIRACGLETVVLDDHALPKHPAQEQREHQWSGHVENVRFTHKPHKLKKTRLADNRERERTVIDSAGSCRGDNRNLRSMIRYW
jgi:hypothetical protein